MLERLEGSQGASELHPLTEVIDSRPEGASRPAELLRGQQERGPQGQPLGALHAGETSPSGTAAPR